MIEANKQCNCHLKQMNVIVSLRVVACNKVVANVVGFQCVIRTSTKLTNFAALHFLSGSKFSYHEDCQLIYVTCLRSVYESVNCNTFIVIQQPFKIRSIIKSNILNLNSLAITCMYFINSDAEPTLVLAE